MKKNWLLILFLTILSSIFLLPNKTAVRMSSSATLTVNKRAVEVGEMISGKATVTLDDHFLGSFEISFGDGTSDPTFICPFNPDAPLGTAACGQNFVHVYNVPNVYQLSLNAVPWPGNIAVSVSEEEITVTARPASAIATSIEPALLATSTGEIIRRIVGVVYWITGSLLVLLIMIGGFTIMTAAGNPEKITKGRKIIVYAIIGFAIMAISRGILALIYLILGINIP